MKLRTILITVSLLPMLGFAAAQPTAVTVSENDSSFTLSNGIVTARVLKSNGDIRSLQYKGIEILTDQSGHAGDNTLTLTVPAGPVNNGVIYDYLRLEL